MTLISTWTEIVLGADSDRARAQGERASERIRAGSGVCARAFDRHRPADKTGMLAVADA